MTAQLIESNLFSSLGDLRADIVLFNPPYVATGDDELEKAQEAKGIEATWAGGKDGVVVLRQFLAQLPQYMQKTGLVYILLISENLPILNELDASPFNWTTIVKKTIHGERQFVVRL